MTLLKEIQEMAVDSTNDITSLLRKCMILAARLGNKELNLWVEKELNGYTDPIDLPAYRKVPVESRGSFVSPFGHQIKNVPISLLHIPEKFRDHFKYAYLARPISAYMSLIAPPGHENPQEYWPADVLSLLNNKVYQDMSCVEAYKVIPFPAVVGMIDTVRNRVLNFSLQIESETPNAGEDPIGPNAVPSEKVSQIFHTVIMGDNQNIAIGSSNVSRTSTAVDAAAFELFGKILDAISKIETDKKIIEKVAGSIEDMRQAYGTKSFNESYKAFMSILADHIQVFGVAILPFMPALSKLLGS